MQDNHQYMSSLKLKSANPLQLSVVNCTREECTHFCGRKSSLTKAKGHPVDLSVLGNPFPLPHYTREESIAEYRKWLWIQMQSADKTVLNAIRSIPAKSVLGCFCFPMACHCDVVIDAANWLHDTRNLAIRGFHGEYRWLSNFWPAPVMQGETIFPTVEHAYVAAKCLHKADFDKVATLATPANAKSFGRKVELDPSFERCKLQIMERLLVQKFAIPELRTKLLDTGDCLIEETNTWNDRFWGVCNGVGLNHLGKIIMKIRSNPNPNETVNPSHPVSRP